MATRHSEFYFDDSLVTIKVEDTLFKVHKRQLLKSEIFSDMFDSAKSGEEGSSVDNPIELLSVSASDFGCLMTTLYASHFSDRHPKPEASLLIPAYRLAVKWEFKDLRIHLLPLAHTSLGAVDRIIFAREFGVDSWLPAAHAELCKRETPLTEEEATRLGVQSVFLIFRLREECYRPAVKEGSKICESCAGYRIHKANRQGTFVVCAACNHGVYDALSPTVPSVSHGANDPIEKKVRAYLDGEPVFSK